MAAIGPFDDTINCQTEDCLELLNSSKRFWYAKISEELAALCMEQESFDELVEGFKRACRAALEPQSEILSDFTEGNSFRRSSSDLLLTAHSNPGAATTLFIMRNADGFINLAIANVVDDFLISGTKSAIESFHAAISARFTVGRFICGEDLIFNRLHIHQAADFCIHVNMREYLQTIRQLYIPRHRRKQQVCKCSKEELSNFLSHTGSLNYLGHGVLPQATFAASHLQQMVGRLTVSCLVTANKALAEIKALNPALTYKAPSKLELPSYLAFSDASQGRGAHGQTGYVSGVYFPAGGERIYHVIDCLSCKQSRVCFSSISAEILAAATSTDRGSLMAEQLQEVHDSSSPLPFVLSVDLNGLYSTITTLHVGSDYRFRPTVQRMRDSFEDGEIEVMQWVAGKRNPLDALTKRKVAMYRKLNVIMVFVILDEEVTKGAKRVRFSDSES